MANLIASMDDFSELTRLTKIRAILIAVMPRLALLVGSSFAGLALAALSACSATPLGASDPNLASAKKGSAPGAEAYERECAACHGKRGEGLTNAPGIIGSGALPVARLARAEVSEQQKAGPRPRFRC